MPCQRSLDDASFGERLSFREQYFTRYLPLTRQCPSDATSLNLAEHSGVRDGETSLPNRAYTVLGSEGSK